MPDEVKYELGTIAASEAIIRDLYLSLRTRLFEWSRVTHQTPQPKMGYIGQHLTSVVTGFPGGRSGARGKDLILPGDDSAEIKTCYRVDQVGACNKCRGLVASVETECPTCGSTNILRKDDSKWLLGPRHDTEMATFFDLATYYFVLFDFEDLADPTTINVRIWTVDPKSPGFAYAMVDYYVNIRAKSTSKAPFNLWPFQLKFQLMAPTLIYHARIDSDNNITTLLFPGERGTPTLSGVGDLNVHSGSRGFTLEMALEVADHFNVELSRIGTQLKKRALTELQAAREAQEWDEEELTGVVAEAMYAPLIEGSRHWLPEALR